MSRSFTHEFEHNVKSKLEWEMDKLWDVRMCVKTSNYRRSEGSKMKLQSVVESEEISFFNEIRNDDPIVDHSSLTKKVGYKEARYFQIKDLFYYIDFKKEVEILFPKCEEIFNLNIEDKSKDIIEFDYYSDILNEIIQPKGIICNLIYDPMMERLRYAWRNLHSITTRLQKRWNTFRTQLLNDGFIEPPKRRLNKLQFKVNLFYVTKEHWFIPEVARTNMTHPIQDYVMQRLKQVFDYQYKLFRAKPSELYIETSNNPIAIPSTSSSSTEAIVNVTPAEGSRKESIVNVTPEKGSRKVSITESLQLDVLHPSDRWKNIREAIAEAADLGFNLSDDDIVVSEEAPNRAMTDDYLEDISWSDVE